MKRLDKAESEIKWLSFMLEQVKDNGQVDYAEVDRRLHKLEGVKLTNEETFRLSSLTADCRPGSSS